MGEVRYTKLEIKAHRVGVASREYAAYIVGRRRGVAVSPSRTSSTDESVLLSEVTFGLQSEERRFRADRIMYMHYYT